MAGFFWRKAVPDLRRCFVSEARLARSPAALRCQALPRGLAKSLPKPLPRQGINFSPFTRSTRSTSSNGRRPLDNIAVVFRCGSGAAAGAVSAAGAPATAARLETIFSE
jgi:hypothetical protein